MPEEALRKLETKVIWYKSTAAEIEKAENALIRYQQDKEQDVSEEDEAALKGDLDTFICVRERMSLIDSGSQWPRGALAFFGWWQPNISRKSSSALTISHKII